MKSEVKYQVEKTWDTSEKKMEGTIPAGSTSDAAGSNLADHNCVDNNAAGGNTADGNAASTKSRTTEHILVCLSSSPSNPRIIRTAARMVEAYHGRFTALFVETPAVSGMSTEDKKRLEDNKQLAQHLGAHVEVVFGEDVPFQIAEFARLAEVSIIVIGRSNATRKGIFSKPTLTERLILDAPRVEVHVIPDGNLEQGSERRRMLPAKKPRILLKDVIVTFLVLLAVTLVGALFYRLGFSDANLVSIYIFAVLIISILTTDFYCGVAASVISVLAFNFLFTVPRYTFHFSDPDYFVTFPIMFMVAILSGSLASRLKDNARQAAHADYRTKILFETNQLLQKGHDEAYIGKVTAEQILKLLERDVVIYITDVHGDKLEEPAIFRTPGSKLQPLDTEMEKGAASWVFKNRHKAGLGTAQYPESSCLYFPIRISQQVYGVVGIAIHKQALDPFENSILLSMLGECALAIENIRNAREKEEAAILAQNEQLRANLLRTISHDLRTPLTSISGNADNLLCNYQKMDDASRQQAFRDIYEDSEWLINLVENLLAITRIEDGRIKMSMSVELMDEVITEALHHVSKKREEHTIRVTSEEDFILARIDARLIVQVLINLVNNAIKYTQPGSIIEIHTAKKEHEVYVSVSDNGPGIPDDQKTQIFDMFYTGKQKLADSRRSLGLGLALCKSIVNAHGGSIKVADNTPHGSVFTFTLPAGEVTLRE
jgi:two-component system sensor histidine kinase KdpD